MKGKTNNPNGRPKGVPNKVTASLRTFVAEILNKNKRQINKDLKALQPKDRLIILERLMQYVIPKQQWQQVDLQQLSDDQLTMIVDEITAQYDESNNT